MSVRIGIDASRATRSQRTGTEGYSLSLLRSLLNLDSDNDYTLYFNAAPPSGLLPTAANIHPRLIPLPRLWTHLRLSFEMARRPPDLLFVPAHVLPPVHPRRSVVTIHDLGYYHEPGAHPSRQRLYLEWATRFNAQSASRIIADSQATRRDLITSLASPTRRSGWCTWVWTALSTCYDPVRLCRQGEYGIVGPYVLFVGTLQPRKNLLRLVEAFGSVARAVDRVTRDEPVQCQ